MPPITFTSGDVELAGTFQPGLSRTAPPTAAPHTGRDGIDGPDGIDGTGGGARAALLISGSGPIDRDSNSRQLRIGVMQQVADRLAAEGVASLRYDKRGVGESEGDFKAAGLYDNVADARAALAALRAQPGVDPDQVVVVGHSEGAVIATELAAADDRLAGAVLVAGSASTGEQVLREQAVAVAETLPRPVAWLLRLLRQDVVATQEKRFAQLRATTGDTARMQLVKVNAKWFREFLDHDPSVSLRAIRVPTLVLAGTKDIQVDPGHATRAAELLGDVATLELVPDASHLLRHEPGEPTVRTYRKQAKQPVLPEVLDRIASFCVDTEVPDSNGAAA